MKEQLIEKLKGLVFFSNWHPEVALRYLPVVREIRKSGKKMSVLDVGSGGLGIAPYLKDEVTGCDIKFTPPFSPYLKKVIASAVKLPFEDDGFDVVISIDMLEHLTKDKREKAIKEMIRVGRRKIILAMPCGQPSIYQDRELSKYYQKNYGRKYEFLEEQLDLGLPEKEEITDIIKSEALRKKLKYTLKVAANENLKLRFFLMKPLLSRNLLINIFYRKILLFALPFLSKINREPAYRKIFIIEKT